MSKENQSEVKRSISEEIGSQIVKNVGEEVALQSPIRVIFGEEAAPLKLHEETPVKLEGILSNPLRWLEKRVSKINFLDAYVMVDREKMFIELVTEERSYFKNELTGSLEFHPIFLLFGINAGRYITPLEMSQLIKMNRFYFENKTDAMMLVSTMKNFSAKVDKDIQSKLDNSGSRTELRQQVVTSNLPESFRMVLPIFKGEGAQNIEVEIVVNPDDLRCTLSSPEASELMEKTRDEAIDGILGAMSKIAPELVILEK